MIARRSRVTDDVLEELDFTAYRVGSKRRGFWDVRPGGVLARLITRTRAGHRVWLQLAYKGTSDRWRRTWQAEWDGCEYAPRAYTERGVVRRSRRRIAP